MVHWSMMQKNRLYLNISGKPNKYMDLLWKLAHRTVGTKKSHYLTDWELRKASGINLMLIWHPRG